MDYEKRYEEAEEYYSRRDYREALNLFKDLYNDNQTNDCLNYIGCCYLMLEDFDYAFEVFKRLIKIAPDWERPVFNLGRVYLQYGRLKEALECFNNAVDLNPYDEDAYFYLGIYYYKIGDYETSRKYYEKSLGINYSKD
ncbi:MAG: tetratricopeptide repeat protein [Clostridium sp.]|nr:tetratricopeptide repeat protein [Clostridium sp.]